MKSAMPILPPAVSPAAARDPRTAAAPAPLQPLPESPLCRVHQPRLLDDLRHEAGAQILRLWPEAALAVLFIDTTDAHRHVELALGGSRCPLAAGDEVGPPDHVAGIVALLPLEYRGHRLGEFALFAEPPAALRPRLLEVLSHYGTALVNLKLNERSLQLADLYCANVQAFEEIAVLFQEQDPEAVAARFLSLCTMRLGTDAGALYLLDDVDGGGPLRLSQTFAVPEPLLELLRLPDGAWWPQTMLYRSLSWLERRGDGSFPDLDPDLVPPALHNVVTVPLRCQGVTAGLCLVLNAALDQDQLEFKLDHVRRIGELGGALFHRLNLEAQALRNKDLETQLRIAATIQKRLLPTEAPHCPALEFAWCSLPAQSVGGDYLDFLSASGGDVLAVIADVSGHGLNSALLMTSFRATYRAEAPWRDTAKLLAHMNEQVVREVGTTGMFITAAALRIRGDGRSCTWASAGHNPVLLYRSRDGSVQWLEAAGPPMGFLAGAEFAAAELPLEAGDVLLLYTDGIVESCSPAGAMFGEERLEALLRQHAAGSAREVLDGVIEALHEFHGSMRHVDDVSVSVIKVR